MNNFIIRVLKRNRTIYRVSVAARTRFNIFKRNNVFFHKVINAFSAKKTIRRENKTVFEYQNDNSCSINVFEPAEYRDIFVPINYPSRKDAYVKKEKSPAIYSTEIDDCVIIGGSNVILKDGFYLNDKFSLPYMNNFNFSVGPVVCFSSSMSEIDVDRFPKKIQKGIYLVGEASNNYYHWVFDILSRLLYLNGNSKYEKIPLLVDETVSRHPTCVKMLEYVDDFSHPIIWIKHERSYRIQSLVYVSPTTWSNVHLSQGILEYSTKRFMKPTFVVDEYRRLLFDKANNCELDRGRYKKIFITRSGDKVKRLINETELSRIAEKKGFTLIDPASFSIIEQVAIFNSAVFVIAASGAALVNLMWCRTGCKVICVSPSIWDDYNYSTLAHLVGAQCIYLDGNMVDRVKHYVSEKMFEEVLDEYSTNQNDI